jgi:hypothetical protein
MVLFSGGFPMPCYHLEIRENEEYGGNGIWFNSGRDYFQPATTGIQLAHDILEHPTTPDANGYMDELMALGAILAGRVDSGWRNKYRQLNVEDLRSDICSLAISSLQCDEPLTIESCKSYLQDSSTMQEIRSFVVKGLEEAIDEEPDNSYNSRVKIAYPDIYIDLLFDVNSIVGWICKGYQLFRERFYNHDIYNISTYLFNKITAASDNFLKHAELGETAKLYVNFTTMEVRLEEEYL